MGAGTYATVMGSGPGLLRRRYSVPEIIMRKHTLAQQKSYDEPPHDSNHNSIVLNNKNYYPSQSPKFQQQSSGSGGPMTRANSKASPILQRKQQQQQQQQLPQSPVLVHRKSITRAASSVESGSGDFPALASTGSESNLASMKRHPSSLGGISRSQKCSSVNGINSSTNTNNNYIVGSAGVSVGLGGAGVLGVGGGGGDFSMRKSTLLRRMWSKEMRRYDRSGSWSPPLRRAPRRIYSIESILQPEGSLASGGGGSGSSEGSCATTTTTSCKECAKLESQYNSNARGGRLAANESPKRLRLAGSLNNINLQKGDSLEALSRTSTPNNRQLISSEGLVDDSASVTTKSSKPEVSSTTETTNTPLIRRKEEVIHDRSKRNFVFMSANDEAELDEADLTSSTSSIASQARIRPVGRAGSTGTILEASEEGTLIDKGEHKRDDDDDDDDGDDANSTILNAHDNESDISEFLKEEAIARKDDYQDLRNHRESPTECGRNTDVDVHSRKRAEDVDNDSAPGDTAVKVTSAGRETEGGLFPLKKQIPRRGSNASSSAISISAESTDSDCVYASDSRNQLDTLTREDVLKNEARLDEYISNLLVDNLNNLLDTKEIAANGVVCSDQKNNNNKQVEESKSIDPSANAALEVETMKHKGTEKYIGGGGGVVCNSPPDHPSNKLKHQQSTVDKDSEKENEDTINNNRCSEENGKISMHYLRKKRTGLGEKQSSTNGFYLIPRNGSRDSDGLPAEIDLNGKYYFPSYGIDTDPSDNTDIASEPEMQIISKIGLGSVYRQIANGMSTIVPRISALPRTESMEVQPSSNSAEEFDDLPDNNGYDSETPSLVDSLDEVEITPRRKPDRRKSLAPPSPAPASTTPAEPTAESTTKSETTSSDKSPRHEKGEAFFVPIQDTTVIIDEHIIVADTMPMRLKERLNNRQRLMIWKKEQENLKKHRKVMRLIEQRKFYGEPAIQVISTIDRAISRKEYIPPAEKKRVFGSAPAFTPKVPKGKKKGSASRTELGMLESYKIDARGNMQIQVPATTATSATGASTASGKKPSKSPWGQAAERRQKSTSDVQSAPTTTKSSLQPATGTAPTTASSKTPKKTPADVRRKHVLKDVQQMTLYPQADLTPDIEGGPRRMYQKTEIQEGDKHIEILEIVECADSAPRRPPRVRSGSGKRSSQNKSRIPVPIYRWGRYRASSFSRENSPLSTSGSNPKVDRMIADLLIEALANPDDVGVKFINSPEDLKDKSKRSPSSRKNIASNSSTPRRSANSGKYTQRFEMIPEERSSVSISSSNEELSSGRKKHASPRRVSFDENHQILNVDEFEPKSGSKLAPKLAVPSPKPSPKQSPKKIAATPNATPSPKASALKKKSSSTTTSRGKAAIESDVVEEKGWIGFSTQHEDMATPVNGEDEEDFYRPPLVVGGALAVNGHHNHHSNLAPKEHDRRNIVKTIVTGNIARDSGSRVIQHTDTSTQHHIVDHFHHHQSVNINVTPATLTAGSVVSVDHVRSTAATVGSFSSTNGAAGVTKPGNQYLAIAASSNGCNRRLTSGEFSDESCFTDSLNVKPSPLRYEDTMISCELAIPVHIEQDIRSDKHGGFSVNELKSVGDSLKEVNVADPCDCSESIYPYRQIREENAWHVYETTDCKVVQSKIEYYETSVHRTPLTENHQSLFGQLADRSPGSLRSALLNATFDNHELVRHELKPDSRMNLTSSDTVDSHNMPTITRTPVINEDAPKTSETCSSCCFCNPELHKHSGNPSETCFYCQAKAQTPSKSFPAPPTPPNIQMSPIPPSPKTPIMELTPTPTFQEISLPPKKTSQPQKPRNHPVPPPPVTPKHTPKPSHNSSKDPQPDPSTSTGTSTTATSINGLYTETTKKTDHTHTKTKTKTSDTVSTKCSTTNEKIKRSYVPSTGDSDKLEEVSKKLTRKKSETTVLNRPKHVNNLNRTSSVVHSVQKEIKNELKTPIKVLPKTAKELSNRKERDKQINLNLPLDNEPPPRHSKSKTTLGFESLPKDKTKPPCASSQSYDETTSSSSTDTSSNSSPFKNCAALPPATRWKHNSERNLTQLTMQKITAASKWGNKWRKAARQHEDDPTMVESTLSPIRRRPAADEMLPAGDLRVNAASATTAATTTTAAMVAAPSIVSGITQSTTNQGWTVTVAGNYNPDMAPDVEMKLSFPKQANASASGGHAMAGGSGGSKRTNHPAMANGVDSSYQSSALAGNRKQQYIEDAHHIPGRGGGGNLNYAVLDDDSYGGGSRGNARAALPPPGALNPKRTLSRTDGTAGGKDYRLPNVGTSNNVTARQNAKKAIKQTMECSVVASATTRTVANKYHMLSHQHQQPHEQAPSHLYSPSSSYHHQQQSSSTVAGPPTTTTTTMAAGGGTRGGRPRAMSIQSLHPSLQNGGGGKFSSSNSHQPRYHDPSSIDYGNVYSHGNRRMSLESPHGAGQLDNLSVMGNAIAPEHKPKVPTMSERDLTRRHHPCYTRNMPYFS